MTLSHVSQFQCTFLCKILINLLREASKGSKGRSYDAHSAKEALGNEAQVSTCRWVIGLADVGDDSVVDQSSNSIVGTHSSCSHVSREGHPGCMGPEDQEMLQCLLNTQ